MNINLIGVPLFYGSDIRGVEKAPQKLRENGIKEILEISNKVCDFGDIFVKECSFEKKYKNHKNAKYLEEIVDVNTNLANNVYLTLKDEKFPLTIGGDHSLALGTVAGTSKYYKEDLAVIWIDAHGDFNNTLTTPSGNIHGMPLAASAGIGIDELTNIYFKGIKVKPENIFIICARDLDSGEIDLIKENKVNIVSTDDVKKLGAKTVVLDILKKINEKQINNIHVSFDVDSIDPKLMPGTGTKVKNGINVDEAITILECIFQFKKVKALDFVEFNPELDNEDIALDNCLILLKKISEFISYYS